MHVGLGATSTLYFLKNNKAVLAFFNFTAPGFEIFVALETSDEIVKKFHEIFPKSTWIIKNAIVAYSYNELKFWLLLEWCLMKSFDNFASITLEFSTSGISKVH